MSAPDYLEEMTAMLHAIRCVTDERGRQLEKWGIQDHPIADWFLILGEEVGEAQMSQLVKDLDLKAFHNHLLLRPGGPADVTARQRS